MSFHKMGSPVDPTCRCHKAGEAALHILCDCECLAKTRAQILGNYFIETEELPALLIRKANVIKD